VNKNCLVIGGNLSFIEVGAEVFGVDSEVLVIETDGTIPIIHKRTDIDSGSPEARILGYEDNRTAELSLDWDIPTLDFDLSQGLDLDGLFSEFDLKDMGIGTGGETTDAEPQIDRASELQEKWKVQPGELFEIGNHRLICGDCTDPAIVARLMGGEKAGACVTDSPYGINREGIENDDPEGLRALFDGCLACMPITDGVIINFQSPRLFPVWLDAVRAAGHKFERVLWMYKSNDETFPWRGWIMSSEIIVLSSTGKAEWLDVHPYSHDCYVYNHEEDLKALEGIHTTVKPTRIIQDLVSRIGGIVYEPFGGSGTTMVACNNLGRKCRTIEISPAYCSVVLQRMQDAFPALTLTRHPLT